MSVTLSDEEFDALVWQGAALLHMSAEAAEKTFELIMKNPHAVKTSTSYSMLNCVSSEMKHTTMSTKRAELYRLIQRWGVKMLNERNPVT